jgi:Fe-S-cluster containining protein
MIELARLHAEVEQRVSSIRETWPDWLCAKGCDRCCRQLAAMPRLTAAEWNVLREGLTALPAERLEAIRRDMAALERPDSRPVVCPLLDLSTGACPVYAQRPVACRTYGFYVQRDKGLYCSGIESIVAEGGLADVVWGNHDIIDQQLAGLGETRALHDWFRLWERSE